MTETQSSVHLSCFIEAIALAKHEQCATRDELKALLEQKGYQDEVTSQTVEEINPQLFLN
ncbi:hypothetical protein [Alteromonas sp.]|jgi:hypothetical protein|uniref:hypothetical protein n=1 Tax=Alteromonas sp. TaxID=232 RepID=UPI000B693A45|nr:hypothetical protein [Alteromonas sp.]MAI36001.1 hypothetical protein [Alteromonas sp.]OUX92366.1 MAG: hypothetical protein CBB95_00285 [Alteromonas sp. TMED35]|tara:strand:- start:4420 stop:4599 length:180 start_codon:yes stop_codon:yes gene_type:complete